MSGTTPPGTAWAKDVPPRPRPPAAGEKSRWTILVVLCVSLLLVAIDATVLHVAVPAVTADLRPGPVELLWIVDAYPLVCASLLILFGTLGDRIGRRKVLLIGYATFGVASALAAYAASPHLLILGRALLGAGGAMIMPATLSILRQVFPDRRERALAVGIWSAVAAVGAAIGPLFGGALLEHFWWGSVFLINIPLMMICLPVGRWLLPESHGDGAGPWDLLGALLAAVGLLSLILALKRCGSGELFTPVTFLAAVVGVGLLVAFARRQRARRYPLIDLSAFSRPAFGTSVGCIVLTVLALVGLALIAAQYLQLVLELSPLQTGLRLLPLSIAAIAAGLLGSRMLHLLGPRAMVALGFVLTALAVVCLMGMGVQDRPLVLAGGFVLLGFGLETTLFGAYESMLNDAPAEEAGAAAAVGETAYQFGAGMGIALLGSLMNAVYGPGIGGVAGVGTEDSEASARSLGEALAVADRIGGETGAALAASAREAFVAGMHMTLVVSVLLLLAGAVAALRLPRGLGPRLPPAPAGAGTGGGSTSGAAAGRVPGPAAGGLGDSSPEPVRQP